MTDDFPSRRSAKNDRSGESRRRPRKRRRVLPWVLGGIALILLVIIGGGVWVGMKALTVKDELEAARPLLTSIKDKVLDGQASSAQPEAQKLAEHAQAAKEAASGPIWSLAESIPVVGANLVAVRVISDSVSDVVDEAVVPAVELGDTLSPAVFKPVDGAVNLDAINSVMPVLDRASGALTSAKQSMDTIEPEGLIGPVKSAVTQINELVGEVEPALATAKQLAPVLPSLLGAEGPRNYLLVFENSAEVRPLGGIAGAQILITADQGRVSIAQQATGRNFSFESEQFANDNAGRELRQLFLVPFGIQSQNNTLTPRVDLAAHLTREMWQRQLGVSADTVVFVDPVALSYVLGATGPIPLPDGQALTSENAVDLLMNQVYQQFSDDADAQDAYFAAAAASTFGAIMNGDVDVAKFVAAIQKAGSERRVLGSSTDQTIQGLIVDAGLQGALPAETDTQRQVGIYFSDYHGSKMEYYMRNTIEVGQAQCTDGSKRIRVQVGVTNTLDPAAVDGLTEFIKGEDGGNNFDVPVGDIRVFAYVYAPPGSSISSITGSTSQKASATGADGEYPVARAVVQSAPGETQSATIDIDASALSDKDVTALLGPLLYQPEAQPLSFSC